MPRLVHEIVFESSERYPNKQAVICDGYALSYKELSGRVCGLSQLLLDAGLEKGDRVLILLRNKADLLVSCYASMAAGGIAVPLPEGSAPATLANILRESGARIVLTSEEELSEYRDVNVHLQAIVVLMNHNTDKLSSTPDYVVFDERIILNNSVTLRKRCSEDDGALILYTSGATGAKKGVLLSHRNLLQASLNINEFMQIDNQIREFISVPLSHSFGFARSRCIFMAGGTLVVRNGMLNPVTMAHTIANERCNALSAVPSGLTMFFGRFDFLLSDIGPQIRFIELGSVPLCIDHKRKLVALFPNARICMHYGLTEASRSTFLEFHREADKLESAGKPSPHTEIGIVDEGGSFLREGRSGEIVVKGRHVAIGYWKNPTLTEERFLRNGWFRTGDYGFLDNDGYLYLLGRKDDMINMSGIKISPLEIEQVLLAKLPDFDCCVVGFPDPSGVAGEIPVLCYVSPTGVSLREHDVVQLLSNEIDKFRIPRLVVQFDSLPKTENHKPKRKEIRKLLIERYGRKAIEELSVNEG
ncbi:MAG TPA: class I adenylate-forming enzyme family protein [Bacteroidota bacterium]|nr:class I adenylate-forming enzyme family protein [Bacteroidota bacterium]